MFPSFGEIFCLHVCVCVCVYIHTLCYTHKYVTPCEYAGPLIKIYKVKKLVTKFKCYKIMTQYTVSTWNYLARISEFAGSDFRQNTHHSGCRFSYLPHPSWWRQILQISPRSLPFKSLQVHSLYYISKIIINIKICCSINSCKRCLMIFLNKYFKC